MDEPRLVRAARKLREHENDRVITVRMPVSYHRILVDAAHAARLSMNKLCLARLLAGHEDEVLAELLRYGGHAMHPPPAEGPLPAEGPPDLLRT